MVTGVRFDVVSADYQNSLYSNLSSIVGSSPFFYDPGQNFSVQVNIVFQACACSPQVIEVTSLTPGFKVADTSPALPIAFGGLGGDFNTASFYVEVTAPTSSFEGMLTLVAHVQ